MVVSCFANWLEYIDAQAKITGSCFSKWGSKTPDQLHAFCTLPVNDLKLLLAANGEGTVMLHPVDGKGNLRLLHHFFVLPVSSNSTHKPYLIAIHGARSIADFVNVPDESIRGKIPRKIKELKVPTIETLMTCEDADSFGEARGDGESPDAGTYFKGWHNAYPLPLSLLPHVGMMTFSAAELAVKAMNDYKNLVQVTTRDEASESPPELKDNYKFLAWLWAIEQGLFTSHPVEEVPEDDDIEDRCREMRARLELDKSTTQRDGTTRNQLPPPPRNQSGHPPNGNPPQFGQNDALMRDVLHSLAKVQEQNARRDSKEQSRKMMTHRLTDEDASLYRYLSAVDFHEEHPEINRFTEAFLSDKDPTKALNLFRGVINRENWDCVPSNNCLIQFFAQGFIGHDFHHTPSGITLFMFWPTSKLHTRGSEEVKMGIRYLFGKDPIDEDSVKTFAKADLYLPTSLDDLLKQIESMIRLLDLITGHDTVASGGYREAQYHLRNHGKRMVGLTKKPSLWVRLGFFIDQVFQTFATDLANIIRDNDGSKRILRAARTSLEGSMERDIRTVLDSCRYGVLPNLVLPTVLSQADHGLEDNANNEATMPGRKVMRIDGRSPPHQNHVEKNMDAQHLQVKDPAWWTRNPDPIPNWRLPQGKRLPEVFDVNDPIKQVWTKGWPQVPHHTSGKQSFVCQRYQVLTNCRKKCRWAHIPPSQLAKVDFEIIEEKLKMAYGST